jgi:hypothetical protein
MSTVPSGTRFIGISERVNLKERKSAVLNSDTQAYTIQDLADTVGIGAQGPQGVQGPAGPLGPVGPAGLNWQGAWVSGTSYVADDAVGYGGASYFCILATSGTTTPNLATTNWALLASQGAQGIQGVQGPTGPQGPAGGAGTLQQTVANGNTVTSGSSITTIDAGLITVQDPDGIMELGSGINFIKGSNISSLYIPNSLTGSWLYELPNASGTIALTSDITGAQVTKVLKTTITSAQVLQLSTTPITVLPAASSGKINIPTNIYIKRNAGTAYTLYNSLALLDNLNIDTQTQINPNPLSNTTVGFMNNSIYLSENTSGNTTNAPYKLKVLDGNPTGGTGNLDVYVTYIEITL